MRWFFLRAIRKALRALLLLLLITGFFFWQNFSIDRETVPVELAALPPEFDALRVLELADLHGRQFGSDSAALLRAAKAARPDLICIDGDLFDEDTELSILPPLLRGLSALAPTYYVTGNHEWQVKGLPAILSELEQYGVRVLRNEYEVLRRGRAELVVAGVDDPCGPYDQKTPEELVAEIRADVGQDACILMLAHRNDTLPLWAELGVDLVLTGHCHGGVVRLPIVGGVFGTNRELFPAYDAGLYRSGGTALYVSRGLGFGRAPLRLFNRPHLPLLVLKCRES